MGWRNKKINRNKEKIIQKSLNSKKLKDKLEYKRNTALATREIEKKTENFLGQICYKFRTRNIQGPNQNVQKFKMISNDVKETAPYK